MTSAEFRSMALALPEAEEKAHMGHPDFRVRGKIFATLGYPDKNHGALVLSPEEQQSHLQAAPRVFSPAAGAWGRAGSTVVRLKEADPETLGHAMTAAWRFAVSKSVKKKPRPASRNAAS